MMRLTPTLVLLTVVSSAAAAQSAQPYSLQASVLGTSVKFGNSGNNRGIGFEAQARYTPLGPVSFGAGVQYSKHNYPSGDELTLSGVFVEPRYALPLRNTRVGVYVAGRGAVLHQTNNVGSSSNGWAVGGGAGLLFHITPNVDFDGGAAVLRQKLGAVTFNRGGTGDIPAFASYVAKAGISLGFGTRKL